MDTQDSRFFLNCLDKRHRRPYYKPITCSILASVLPRLVSCCRPGRGRARGTPRAHCRELRTIHFRASGAKSHLNQHLDIPDRGRRQQGVLYDLEDWTSPPAKRKMQSSRGVPAGMIDEYNCAACRTHPMVSPADGSPTPAMHSRCHRKLSLPAASFWSWLAPVRASNDNHKPRRTEQKLPRGHGGNYRSHVRPPPEGY